MLTPDQLDMELDQFVERFELARQSDPSIGVEQFMPAPEHPRYAAIGCELLRVDMELSASAGQAVSLASYLERFPAICQQSLYLRELSAEAKRVACEQDEPSHRSPGALSFKPVSRAPVQPGQTICGFRLIAELGRGAFSWVYLATDAALSQRPVALKVSSQFPGESQLLSRLQHKNIVPIYSLHQWNEYHILCMPFLGALTLADLLDNEKPASSGPLSGQALIETLMNQASRTWKDELPEATVSTHLPSLATPTDRGLSTQLQAEVARMSTSQLALWIVAELADGLAHAHSRGILHRDIKPANVLLSDDGLPMLLDFNLAADTRPDTQSERIVGGTLRYMAPEQLHSVLQPSTELDGRADVYSLGVVLFELLTLKAPFPDRTGKANEVLSRMIQDRATPPKLQPDWTRGLTPAIVQIIQRALASEPNDRYASAEQFRDELQRQLTARPLQHTRDRSLRERITKWNRRHPRLSSLTLTSVFSIALLMIAISSWWLAHVRAQRLSALDWFHSMKETEAVARNLVASQNAPSSSIDQWLAQTDETLSSKQLRQIDWLPPIMQSEMRQNLSRLHFYQGQGWLTLAARDANNRQHCLKEALKQLTASQSYGASETIQQWLKSVEQALMRDANKSEPGFTAELPKLTSSEIAQEIDLAAASIDRHATNPWYWLSLGQLQLAQGHLDKAQANFEVGQQLATREPLPAFFLGVVEMKRKHFDAAEQWFSIALDGDPNCTEAILSRAALRVEMRKYQEALGDIEQLGSAIERFPRAWFIRERAELRSGLKDAAKKSLAMGLAATPTEALGWNARGEARLRQQPQDVAGALSDFQTAIQCDPQFRNAYENAAHVLAEKLNRPTEALEYLKAVLEVDPEYALAYSSRAVLYARAGQADKALADIQRALMLERTSIVCYQSASALAIINTPSADGSKSTSNKPTAMELIKEALRLDPKLNRLMQQDPDLSNIKNNPEFKSLLEAARTLQ